MALSVSATIFGVFSFAAGTVSVALAVYLSPHWKNRSAGKLILLQVSIAVWALAYSMEFFSPGLSLILWWVKLEYFGAAWVGLFLLDFTLAIARKQPLSRAAFLALSCVPAAEILLVLTNDHHHLIWRLAWLNHSGLMPVVEYVRGPGFWAFVAFSYGLLIISTLVLILAVAAARGLLKKQLVSLLVGIMFPWLANIVYLVEINGGGLPDFTPVAFTVSGAAFAWGLLRYQMLSLIPLAHETMIESMGDPVISLDTKDRILDINKAAQAAFSLDKGVPDDHPLERVFPELHHHLVRHRGALPAEAEISLDRGGRMRDWDMRVFPLLKPSGKKSGWLIILRDVTDRKTAQAALVESERIHRTILEAAPNPILLCDENGRVTHSNPAFTRVFGWERGEIRGKPVDFIPRESREATQAALKQILEQKKIYNFITRRLTKSGETIDVSINSALCRASDGSRASMVVNFTDITKIKETEKVLIRTQNYIRSILNSMPSILIGLDDQARITHWNQEAHRLTGVDAQTAEGRDLTRIFPQLSSHIRDISRIIQDQKVRKEARVPLTFAADPILTDITIYPIASDSVRGAVVRVDDISERARIEEMMVQSEKMLSVGGLAAGMAHEINNPLAGMIQSIQVIRNRLTKPISRNIRAAEHCGINMDSLKAYLENRQILSMMDMMTESGLRAARIVSNMLSFSKKSGRSKSPHYLDAILDETIALIRNDYRMKKQYDFRSIKITKAWADNLPPVVCEKGEIQQVLLNILRNGAEAMVDAGVPAPCFTIRHYQRQDHVVVEIQDNGPGMDREIRKRIFEPFFTTKDVGVGTGLGLSVSYFIIAENHRGTLEVTSVPGKGATFVIALPLSRHGK